MGKKKASAVAAEKQKQKMKEDKKKKKKEVSSSSEVCVGWVVVIWREGWNRGCMHVHRWPRLAAVLPWMF